MPWAGHVAQAADAQMPKQLLHPGLMLCQRRVLELLSSTTWNKWVYLLSSVSPWWELGSPGKASGAQKWDENCSLCTGGRELRHFCAGLGPRVSQWAQGEGSQPKNYRNCKRNTQSSVGGSAQTQQGDASCARVSWGLIRSLGLCSLRSSQVEQPLNVGHCCPTATTCWGGLDVGGIFGRLFRGWGFSVLNRAKGHVLLNANLWHLFSLSGRNSWFFS